MKKVIACGLAAVLAGCSGQAPADRQPLQSPSPPQTYAAPTSFPDRQGMVVFYRQGGLEESMPTVFADNHIVGSLLPNHFAQTPVCSGTTLLRADSRSKRLNTGRTLSLVTRAGQVSYVRVDEGVDGFTLVQVAPDVAEAIVAPMIVSHVANRHTANCPAPAPVAAVVGAASVAVPVVAARPAESVTREVNLKSDALFGFGRSGRNDISSTGITQLNKLITDIRDTRQGLKVERIRVVGHTDRLGKPESNKRLSLARADTVAEYILSHGLIIPIETIGRGSEDPVTRGCKGKKRTAKLVACLQPDRRVTIDLIGLVVDPAP